MLQWIHRRLDQEEGISLVEVLVSILLLALVLVALGSTMTASMATARQDESLTHGTALATEVMEDLHARPWAQLGFYNNDGPDWRATVPELGGLSTVSRGTLPASPEPGRLVPLRTVDRDGKTYTVRTDVAWQQTPRYMRFRVAVTWSDGSVPRSVTLEGRRTRRSSDAGGLAVAPEGFVIKVFTVNPDPVILSSGGLTVGSSEYGGAAGLIEVETNEPAQSVTVTWAPSRSANLTAVSGSGGLKWSAPLPVNQSYSHGYVTFTATATKQGAPTTQYVDQTAAKFTYPVAPLSLNWDIRDNRSYTGVPGPNYNNDKVCITTNNNQLRNDNPFNLAVTGLDQDDSVQLIRVATGVSYPFVWQSDTSSGSTWQAVVPRSSAVTFTLYSTTDWIIRWNRSYDGTSGDFTTLRLYILNSNGNSAC